jgi:hypothetical protein
VRETICTALPWLALILTLLGMRDWDPIIPVGLLAVIALVWAINWLVHHISPPWARYLHILFWALIVGLIIAIPELRASFEEAVRGLLSLQSSTLIVLALATLIVWGVLCLARTAAPSNSR